MAFWKKKQEIRAENLENDLITALIGRDKMTKREALEIPSVSACVDIIARTVASLPVCLYKQEEGKTKKIQNDERILLLNKDTNDTLTPFQFWQAMIEDYYLDSGGYAYIKKDCNHFKSLHYVEQSHISIISNCQPIFKDYAVFVNGERFWPHNFIKILRKTKDGCHSLSVVEEHTILLAVLYNSMKYENALVKKGGNKKGFLSSEKALTKDAINSLKQAYKNLYSNNDENVVVLNSGIKFQESANTSVEMQLNENKLTNANEAAKIFCMPVSIIKGNATKNDIDNFIQFCLVPLLKDIETALNRDLLLESEKGSLYFAFDTRELNRGNIKERYEAYQIALKSHFLQPDEVRDKENLEPLGIDWIELGLDSVLYNIKTKEIYTPNTNALGKLEGGEADDAVRNKKRWFNDDSGLRQRSMQGQPSNSNTQREGSRTD